MIYIGIDPGLKGSLAFIHDSNIGIYKYDNAMYRNVLASIADDIEPAICCLEHVNAMPGNGSVSMFNFGANFGWIQGVLQSFNIPFELVRPQKWKKEFSISSDKNTSIEVCKRLFPAVSLLPTDKCRKDDDNMAEALLMAEYARRKL